MHRKQIWDSFSNKVGRPLSACFPVLSQTRRSYSPTSINSDQTESSKPFAFLKPGFSHLKGVSSPSLREQRFGDLFRNCAEKYDDREFIYEHETGKRVSWQTFYNDGAALASSLLELGYKPGERIGIWMPNCYAWLKMQLAAALIGVISVNVNPAYRSTELEHALNLVGVKGILVMEQFRTTEYITMLRELCPEMDQIFYNNFNGLHCRKIPSLRHIFTTETSSHHSGTIDLDLLQIPYSEINWSGITKLETTLDCYDPINIQFTSGTTGRPKAATLTHHSIINNAVFIGDRMDFSTNDKLCVPVPFYHCFGDVLGFLACATHGSSMALPAKHFDSLATLEVASAEKCTALHGVPTMFIAMLEHEQFPSFDLSMLRTGVMAGSQCPSEIMKRVIDRMNMKHVTICYGMTETSPVSFQTVRECDLETRTETVGYVHPHVEVKITNQKGDIMPVGTSGELLVKGYIVMKGYWDQPEKTEASIDSDGFMHTGDVCVIDEIGRCCVEGRETDLIIRGGENIYPAEVERLLYTHPNIKDVSVVGVPDRKYIEEVCAYIIPKTGHTLNNKDIKSFCNNQISHFKIPKYVICVNEFPLTVTGKIQKFKLRELFENSESRKLHNNS
eukprot:247167_1